MRKFFITSPNYTGQAEIVFNAAGVLSKVLFTDCELSVGQVMAIKAKLPAHISQIEAAFKDTAATVVEAEFEADFAEFWKLYPYKRNKHLAAAYWPKMKKADQVQAIIAVVEYAAYLKRNEWCQAKIAELWLKKGEYLNDWKKL